MFQSLVFNGSRLYGLRTSFSSYLAKYGVQLANILEIVYPPTMFAAKLAVLLQIKRIFTAHQKDFIYWSVQILITANFLTYLACFLAFVFACWPRDKIWNPHIPGKCISTNASIIATSAINVLSDITILPLPIHGVMMLHIPLKKKIGVGAIFATGALSVHPFTITVALLTPRSACISSIIRLVYSVNLTHTHDITWAIAPVGMWACVLYYFSISASSTDVALGSRNSRPLFSSPAFPCSLDCCNSSGSRRKN